jgi:outer membrane protein OmpA-like peptidoglycan-associated protein
MKNVLISLVLVVSSLYSGMSQPVKVNVFVKNQLTGIPLDVTLDWYSAENIARIAKGKYEVMLDDGKEETLTISSDGYFDSALKLDYETVKANPDLTVDLQPGIPQLYISILNDETGETLRAAIDLFTMDESSIVFSEEVEVSPYTIDLEYDKVHVLQVRASGFFSFKDTLDFSKVFDGRVRQREIKLVPLKAGNKISLSNIYFKPNESGLTDFAQLMLVELTHILEQQKRILIEVGAFTDDTGSDDYNLELSGKRAMAVKNYLLEKGADERQLIVKGYGESSPRVPNNSEENRALNRRVEFKIITIQ